MYSMFLYIYIYIYLFLPLLPPLFFTFFLPSLFPLVFSNGLAFFLLYFSPGGGSGIDIGSLIDFIHLDFSIRYEPFPELYRDMT